MKPGQKGLVDVLFFKSCYNHEKQFKQCLHFARQLFDLTTMSSSRKEEALVGECIPNVWWGCGKDNNLLLFSAKVEAAYAAEAIADGSTQNIVQICLCMLVANEGQNSFGKKAGPFLTFLQDFPDYNNHLHLVLPL